MDTYAKLYSAKEYNMIPEHKRNNDGWKELRRYMALMANKKLRYKVFEY